MPDLLPFPVTFPIQLSTTIPDGDAEEARKLSDRLKYVNYYFALLLGLPMDVDITGPVPLNVSLLGHRNQDTRWVDGTHVQLDADVVLTGAANSRLALHTSPVGISVNIGLAGPAVNGRDQAGAFPNNSFVHFYWIYNGITLATLASLAPPVPAPGPTLPAGYYLGAYAGCMKMSGASLLAGNIRGRWTHYKAARSVLVGGVATADTTIDCSSAIPANATRARVVFQAAGTGGCTATIKDALGDVVATIRSTLTSPAHIVVDAPIYSQQLIYALSDANTVLSADVLAFENPNAG